jgi:peptidyl-prolyl cis-trans isomerase A (cyclophilin A)
VSGTALAVSVSAIVHTAATMAAFGGRSMFQRICNLVFVCCLVGPAAAQPPDQSASKPATTSRPAALPRVAFDIVQGDQAWGTIVLELDEQKAPITVKNFLRYVDEGYYDGTLIHRVVVGANARIQVFQGGGYTELNGASKPGQHEPIQLESDNGLRNVRGTIAMARDAAPDTATSEYFVNIEDNPKLDFAGPDHPGYAVFGRIVEGMDVVDKIKAVETRTNPDPELKGEKSQPANPPAVKKTRRIAPQKP